MYLVECEMSLLHQLLQTQEQIQEPHMRPQVHLHPRIVAEGIVNKFDKGLFTCTRRVIRKRNVPWIRKGRKEHCKSTRIRRPVLYVPFVRSSGVVAVNERYGVGGNGIVQNPLRLPPERQTCDEIVVAFLFSSV